MEDKGKWDSVVRYMPRGLLLGEGEGKLTSHAT